MFQACYPNTLDTTVNFHDRQRQAGYVHHHRRHQRHVAARFRCPGAGVPAAVQTGPAPGGDGRGADPPSDRVHPARPLRQRFPCRTRASPARTPGTARTCAPASSNAIGNSTRPATASASLTNTGKSPGTAPPSTPIGGRPCAWPKGPCASSSARTGNGPYRFEGRLANAGWGPPIKPTGMICTCFRASDDPCQYLFNVPDNLFAVTALGQLAEMDDAMQPGDGAGRGEVSRPGGRSLGHTLLMEDAGLPGLVSIPYFTPSLTGVPVVLASRAFAFSFDDPFWNEGTVAEGTGSPHGAGHNGQGLGLAAGDRFARPDQHRRRGDHEMPHDAQGFLGGHGLPARVVLQR